MNEYTVYGKVTCFVSVKVKAESTADAVEKAYEEFGGVNGYAGNGGWNKLIGVSGTNETIEAGDEVDWEEPEEEIE